MGLRAEIDMFTTEKKSYCNILMQWNRSLWRVILKDLFVLCASYWVFSCLYRFVLIHNEHHRSVFEQFLRYVQQLGNALPLTLLLSFFVDSVLGRYWEFVKRIPKLQKVAFFVQAMIRARQPDQEKRVHLIKRSIVRHANLAWLLCMTWMSWELRMRFCYYRIEQRVKDFKYKGICSRFCPHCSVTHRQATLKEVFENMNADPVVTRHFGRIITEEEQEIFFDRQWIIGDEYIPEWWIPLRWATSTLNYAAVAGYFHSDETIDALRNGLNEFRDRLSELRQYTRFNIPLVYTQAVIILIHVYFVTEIFSITILTDKSAELAAKRALSVYEIFNLFMPFVSIFRFLLYMGWFKIGLNLINPLREDQSRFPMSKLLNYNIEVSTQHALTNNSVTPRFMRPFAKNFKAELLCQLERAYENALGVAEDGVVIDYNVWPVDKSFVLEEALRKANEKDERKK